MKKNILIWFASLITVMLALSLTACSDKDDEPSDSDGEQIDENLVGEWFYYEYYEYGTSFVDVEEYSEWLTFKADGTWEVEYEYYDLGDFEQGKASGTYTANGKKATLKCKFSSFDDFEKGEVVTVSYKIKGKTMIFDDTEYTRTK